MRRNDWVRTGTFAAVALVVAAAFLAGCRQPQQEPANEKQARLLATQSADLQKQLAAREIEIAALRQKYAQDLQKRDEDLAQCRARIGILEKDIEKGIAERVSGVTATIMDENAKLRKEIEELKAEVQELKRASRAQEQP